MRTHEAAHSAAAAPRTVGRSLTGRASLNAVAAGLDYSVRVLVELVVSPLIVSSLGPAAYGAWRVLWQWSGYVWGASGRSAQALQFAVANRQWTASTDEKRQLVGAALLVWALFLPLLLSAGGLGVWLGPHVLDVPPGLTSELRVAAAILVLDAVAVTVLTLPRSVLQGENLGYTRMGATTVLIVIGGALLALAVELDLGLPGMAGATVVSTLLTGATFWYITRRRLPWFGVSRPSRPLVRWLLGLSAWFLGWKFVLELMLASDVLVLAAFSTLSVVAAFALSKFVADSLVQAMAMLVQATIPGIGAHLGAGNLRKAAALRGEVMALTWLAGTSAGTAVVLWNGSFVGLWVGDHLYAGRTVTLLVVVLALQITLIRTDTFVIDVALTPRAKVVSGAVSAALSVALAAVGIGLLDAGVVGLCLGLLAGRAVLGVVAPWKVARILGLRPVRQLRGISRAALTTALLLMLSYVGADTVTASSWAVLVAGVAATVAAAAGCAAVAGLSADMRGRLVARVRALLRRRRGEPT